MRPVFEAFHEWLKLRGRLRDERRFHIERASADLRALGVSARSAKKIARARWGHRVHARAAIREIGGDFGGLLRLLRAWRVTASLWLRPLALLAAMALMLLLSPSRWVLIESIAGRPLHSDPSPVISFSAPAPWPLFSGITGREFEKLRSLRGIRDLERCYGIYGCARVAPWANPASIEAEARRVSGNSHISVISQFQRSRLGIGPALATWAIAVLFGLFSLRANLRRGRVHWLIYAGFVGLLHLLASLTAWGVALQFWSLIRFPTSLTSGLIYATLLVAYMLSVPLHCRWWRRDLFQRCPVCLQRLLLTSTEGTVEGMLLDTAVTESVCAQGHGTLIETRWEMRFRCDEPDLSSLMHV